MSTADISHIFFTSGQSKIDLRVKITLSSCSPVPHQSGKLTRKKDSTQTARSIARKFTSFVALQAGRSLNSSKWPHVGWMAGSANNQHL